MQAVQLARYHTRRSHLVRFCGAYHGWWGDVQPGVGNPMPAHETDTLRDMSDDTLRVLERRLASRACWSTRCRHCIPTRTRRRISLLIDSARKAHFDRKAYTEWLHRLRTVCTRQKIVLIFDEVFVGFRLGIRGAQEYFGVPADLVTYGKTLGGGLPIGVVCGRKDLMKRFQDDRPTDVCFARGTFNSHPYAMGAMYEFLVHLDMPQTRELYRDLDRIWDERAQRLNERLPVPDLPVQVANMSSIWIVCYTHPSRYNWMLQYYLHAEGLGAELDWNRSPDLQPQLHRGGIRRSRSAS